MKDFATYANHITSTVLISVLLLGSWLAGQSSRSGGDVNSILLTTFLLLIPCAITVIYLQIRGDEEEV